MAITEQIQAVNRSLKKANGFVSASILDTSYLNLSHTLHSHMGGVIDHFEAGTITLIESDQVSPIHTELHTIMAKATEIGWKIKFIDIANCFNPHLISAITFNTGISSHEVLKNVSLSRPFQIHQSTSIIKGLPEEIAKTEEEQIKQNGAVTPQLIIITDISAQFFDPALASENKNFPVEQLELLRHVLGVLQGLATQGHLVVMTENTNPKQKNESNKHRVQKTPLAYAANVHIRIKTSEWERKIFLLNHPFLAPEHKLVELKKIRRAKNDDKQSSLDDWY